MIDKDLIWVFTWLLCLTIVVLCVAVGLIVTSYHIDRIDNNLRKINKKIHKI